MPLWQILVLAVVQGLTEFLPISSDGHLVVVAALMAPQSRTAEMDVSEVVIVLHGGTLLSILVYYFQRIWELLRADRRSLGLLLVATIPAVVVGLPAKLYAEQWLASPVLAGIFLIVTGIVLIIAGRLTGGTRVYSQLGYSQALWIGVAQAAAILPGLSRSGSTIATGMRMQLHPRSAATFSFLMAIPVIVGACLLQLVQIVRQGTIHTPIQHLALGVLVAFISGLISLSWLVKWLERGRFALFAWWCIPLGIAVLVWQLQT